MARGDIVKVVVAPVTEDCIQIRWDRRLDSLGKEVRDVLLDELEELDAVERVTPYRYSAKVYVATHVQFTVDVIQAIGKLLTNTDSEFRSAPVVRLSGWEFQVSLLKDPLIIIG